YRSLRQLRGSPLMVERTLRTLITAAVCLTWPAVSGCALPAARDRESVSHDLAKRTGLSVEQSHPDRLGVPDGFHLSPGLTEEQAVLIALWNNAAFHEFLTDLGIAHGDLVQAGLLPNPEFVYYFPMHLKPFKYILDFPIEALWLRPIRIAAAERESSRVGD